MTSADTPNPRILLVGHCGPDSYMLRSAVQRVLPGGALVMVNDGGTLETEMRQADGRTVLLLINRVLDGTFETQDGIDLIRRLHDAPAGGPAAAPAMMLVSNLDDAQDQAVRAGALPGFGKKDAYSDETRRRLLAAVAGR